MSELKQKLEYKIKKVEQGIKVLGVFISILAVLYIITGLNQGIFITIVFLGIFACLLCGMNVSYNNVLEIIEKEAGEKAVCKK